MERNCWHHRGKKLFWINHLALRRRVPPSLKSSNFFPCSSAMINHVGQRPRPAPPTCCHPRTDTPSWLALRLMMWRALNSSITTSSSQALGDFFLKLVYWNRQLGLQPNAELLRVPWRASAIFDHCRRDSTLNHWSFEFRAPRFLRMGLGAG